MVEADSSQALPQLTLAASQLPCSVLNGTGLVPHLPDLNEQALRPGEGSEILRSAKSTIFPDFSSRDFDALIQTSEGAILRKLFLTVGGVSAILLCIFLSIFLYANAKQNKLIEAFTPHVKNTTLRVENAMLYEVDNSPRITYFEYFAKLEADVLEVEKRVLEVQTLSSTSNVDISEPTVAYLKAGQNVLRALIAMYTKQQKFAKAIMLMKSANKIRDDDNEYTLPIFKEFFDSAEADVSKARLELVVSLGNVATAISKIAKERDTLSNFFAQDALYSPLLVKKLLLKQSSHPVLSR